MLLRAGRHVWPAAKHVSSSRHCSGVLAAGCQLLLHQHQRCMLLSTPPESHQKCISIPRHADSCTCQLFWSCRGTILGTTAVVSKVLLTNSHAIDWGLLPRALMGLLALLCGNGYIVGINQIYDVDIDAVNKPFLPVAAGEAICLHCAGDAGMRLIART